MRWPGRWSAAQRQRALEWIGEACLWYLVLMGVAVLVAAVRFYGPAVIPLALGLAAAVFWGAWAGAAPWRWSEEADAAARRGEGDPPS